MWYMEFGVAVVQYIYTKKHLSTSTDTPKQNFWHVGVDTIINITYCYRPGHVPRI